MTKNIEKKQIQFTAGLIAIFAIFAICMMGFVKIAWDVREKDTVVFEDMILNNIHHIANPFLDAFMPVATDAGGIFAVAGISLVIMGIFIYKNEYRRAVFMALCMGGAVVLNVILKAVFERARPDLWDQLVHESSYSFPSGHSMMTAALGSALIVALWNSRWRWWAIGFAAIYIPFIGFTRLYLGVHYPTDVLAGWLVSGAWVMAVTLFVRSRLGMQALKHLR